MNTKLIESIPQKTKREFRKRLRKLNILNAQNQPYSRYREQRFFIVKGREYKHPITGEAKSYTRTYATHRGLLWISRKLNLNHKAAS